MMISYTAKPLHRYIELIGDRRWASPLHPRAYQSAVAELRLLDALAVLKFLISKKVD